MDEEKSDITTLLLEIENGSEKAFDNLFSIVYNELRDLAHSEVVKEPHQSLTKTVLVHELYLKLLKQKKLDFKSKAHFFTIAARSMRQILIDYARKKKRQKRGGHMQAITYIDEIFKGEKEVDEFIHIDKALKSLEKFDGRLAKIVELHYFGEMSFYSIAHVLNLSERSVYRDWAMARGWLYKELKKRK